VQFAHVGRQSVHRADGSLFGYELLFRDSVQASSAIRDDDDATTATILAAFSDFPPGDLLGGRRGLVNLTRAFLIGDLPVPFEPDEAILEVLPTVLVDDRLTDGISALADAGYLIALDDYSLAGPTARLLPLAHLIKVDVLGRSWQEVTVLGELAAERGMQAVAERVETEVAVDKCHAAGYTLFQGYWFSRPETRSAPTVSAGRAAALRLIAELADPAVSVSRLERVLRSDPGLTYRLLKASNSAASGLSREVSSIRDAIVVVGLTKLRAWAVLFAFAGGRPAAMTEALTRARACELLAQDLATAPSDVAFTVGLLDGLADGLGLPPAEFLAQLPPLAPELVSALHSEPGPLSDILTRVSAYQEVDADDGTGPYRPALAAGPDDRFAGPLSTAYLSAWSWATRTTAAFGDD
jgi:EAL and modified HD-GYP domain-containing signal transduction protein